MSTIDDGGPAFPTAAEDKFSGLSKREFYAAQVAAAMTPVLLDATATVNRAGLDAPPVPASVAGVAFAVADAMIAASKAEVTE